MEDRISSTNIVIYSFTNDYKHLQTSLNA